MYDQNNQRMVGCCMAYNKALRELWEEYGVPRPQNEHGESLCDLLIAHVGQIRRKYAKGAAREGYLRGLRVAAQHLPDDPEEGLYVPRGLIVIKSASVGRIITHPFNSWSHL